MNRPNWNEYFFEMASLVAKRSTCLRRKVGAIAVLDKRILATGYNGPVSGDAHCVDIGCLREKLQIPSGERHELCSGVHAEQNVIIQAAMYGIPIKGATLYCTHKPCSICDKMLRNCGITKILWQQAYPDLSF